MGSSKIQWHYHRKGCVSCQRAQDFLTKHHLVPQEQVLSSKKLQLKDARLLLENANRAIIAKGTKVQTFDFKKQSRKEAEPFMLGPTGNLRAPLLVVGSTLLVGFNENVYEQELVQ